MCERFGPLFLLVACMLCLAGSCSTPPTQLPSPEPTPSLEPLPESTAGEVDVSVIEPDSFLPSATEGPLINQELLAESRSTPEPEEKQPIVVSNEVFTKTFSDVEKLIFLLNDIIKSQNYKLWITHLSDDYIKIMSDSKVLEEKNKSPTLKRLGLTLKSLDDYFRFVVVPSRANSRLDDLVFLSETEVEAIMIVGNRRVIVYKLVKIDGQWKVGLS